MAYTLESRKDPYQHKYGDKVVGLQKVLVQLLRGETGTLLKSRSEAIEVGNVLETRWMMASQIECRLHHRISEIWQHTERLPLGQGVADLRDMSAIEVLSDPGAPHLASAKAEDRESLGLCGMRDQPFKVVVPRTVGLRGKKEIILI